MGRMTARTGLYTAGVPYLRSFAWATALGGEAVILWRLL